MNADKTRQCPFVRISITGWFNYYCFWDWGSGQCCYIGPGKALALYFVKSVGTVKKQINKVFLFRLIKLRVCFCVTSWMLVNNISVHHLFMCKGHRWCWCVCERHKRHSNICRVSLAYHFPLSNAVATICSRPKQIIIYLLFVGKVAEKMLECNSYRDQACRRMSLPARPYLDLGRRASVSSVCSSHCKSPKLSLSELISGLRVFRIFSQSSFHSFIHSPKLPWNVLVFTRGFFSLEIS